MNRKIMHASMKQGQRVRECGKAIARQKPFICTVTEMDVGSRDFKAQLKKGLGKGYRVLSKDNGGRSEENMIVMRRNPKFKVQSVNHTRFSPDGGDSHGWDNERGCQVVRYYRRALLKKNRRYYAAVGTHWDAVIQSKEGQPLPGSRLTRVMVNQSPGLERVVRELLTEGRAVSVGGDLNWSEAKIESALARIKQPRWTPRYLFQRLGMTTFSVGVDWLTFAGWVPETTRPTVIRPGEAGNVADHPWVWVKVSDDR